MTATRRRTSHRPSPSSSDSKNSRCWRATTGQANRAAARSTAARRESRLIASSPSSTVDRARPRRRVPLGHEHARHRRRRAGSRRCRCRCTATPHAIASISIRPNCSRHAAGRLARRAQHVIALSHRGISPCGTPVTTLNAVRDDRPRNVRRSPSSGRRRRTARAMASRRRQRSASSIAQALLGNEPAHVTRPPAPRRTTRAAGASVAGRRLGHEMRAVSTPGGITRDGSVGRSPPVATSVLVHGLAERDPPVRPARARCRSNALSGHGYVLSDVLKRRDDERARRDGDGPGDLRAPRARTAPPSSARRPSLRSGTRRTFAVPHQVRTSIERGPARSQRRTPRPRSARAQSHACRRESVRAPRPSRCHRPLPCTAISCASRRLLATTYE